MPELLVLRHAKSSWKDPGLQDHDRPLNKRGKRDAPRMGALIAREGLRPDVVLCSTAVRARETWHLLSVPSMDDVALQLLPELYHADATTIRELLRSLPPACPRAMVIGHNPGLEELVLLLCRETVTLPTAALARLTFDGPWSGLQRAALVASWRPKQLA